VLTAAPKRWYSWNFEVLDGRRPVADVGVSCWRERGTLQVDGERYDVYREGWASGAFVLESHGEVLARATKPSAFERRLLVWHAGREYTLRARFLGRQFLLFEGSSEVGRITPEGLLTRRAQVDLPAELPLPVRVFLVWLAVLMWKRAAAAASS